MPEAWCGMVAKRRSSGKKQQAGSTSQSSARAPEPPPSSAPALTEEIASGQTLLEQLQAALTELDGKLSAAERTLAELAEGVDFPEVLGETLENLQATVTQLQQQLPEAIRYNTESIVALHGQVASLEQALDAPPATAAAGSVAVDESTIAELRDSIAQLEDRVANPDREELQQSIAQCQQDIASTLASQTSSCDQLQQQLSELEEKLTDTAGSSRELAGISATLAKLKATVGQLENQQERETIEIQKVETALQSVQQATQELEQRLATEIAERSTGDISAADISTQIAQLQTQISEFEAHVEVQPASDGTADLQDQLDRLQASVTSVVQQIPETIQFNTDTAADLEGQIRVLQDRLVRMESTVDSVATAETGSQLETAIAALQTAQAELQEELSSKQSPNLELQSAVSDLSTRLDSLQQQLPEAAADNTQTIVSLQEQLASIETSVRAIHDDSILGETIAQLRDATAQLEDSSALTNSQLEEVRTATEELPTLQSAYADLERRVTAAESRPSDSDLHEQLELVREELEARARVEAITPLERQLEELKDELESVTISQLESNWQAAIEELRATVTSVSEQIPEAIQFNTETANGLEQQIRELQQTVTQLESSSESAVISETISELEAAIAALQKAQLHGQEDLAAPSPPDSDLQQSISDLSTRLESLQQQLPEAVSYNTQSIVSLHEQLASLEITLAQLEGKDSQAIATLEKSIASTNRQLANALDVREQVETLEITYEDIDKRMDAIDLVTRAVERQVSAIQDELESRAGVEDVEAVLLQLQELQTELRNPAPEEPAWQAEIDKLQTSLDSIEEQIPTEDIARLADELSQLQARLSDRESGDTNWEDIATLQVQFVQLEEAQERQSSAGQLTDANLRSFGQDLSRLAERIDRLQLEHPTNDSPSEDSQQASHWQAELQEIDTKVDRTVATVAEQGAALNALQEQLARWQPDVVAQEPQLESAPTEAVVQLRSDVDALQPILQKSSELENQVSTLATTLYALQTTITPLEQQLPEALRYNTQSVVELQEQLEALRQQVEESASDRPEDSNLQTLIVDFQQVSARQAADRESISQLQQALSDLDSKLDTGLLNTVDTDSIVFLQTEIKSLAVAIQQQAESFKSESSKSEEIQQEIEALGSQFEELEQKLPEAVRYNTQSLVTLQSNLATVESQLEDASQQNHIEDLQAEIDTLVKQQRFLKLWIFSSIGVAIAALAAASSQVFNIPLG